MIFFGLIAYPRARKDIVKPEELEMESEAEPINDLTSTCASA